MTSQNRFVVLLLAAAAFLTLASCKQGKEVAASSKPAPVPATQQPVAAPVPAAPSAPVKTQVKMKVAVVMQFDLTANFAEDTTGAINTEMDLTPASVPAVHFYEGVKLAIDSLLSDSVMVTVNALDAPADSAGAAKLFGGPMLRGYDVVIAGLQPSIAAAAAAAASKSGIKLLLLQAPSSDVLTGPETALATASTFTQCRKTAVKLATLFPSAHFVVVSRKLRREHELAAVFAKALKEQPHLGPVIEFDVTSRKVADIKNSLRAEKRNIVIVASSDEAFVKDATIALNDMGISGIYVCGLPTWSGFESIDYMSFENLKFFLFDNNYTDLSDPEVNAFRKQFLSDYHTDPMPQGFNGFDLMLGLGMQIRQGGSLCDMLARAFGGDKRYQFSATQNGGCENAGVTLLTVEDYSFKSVE